MFLTDAELIELTKRVKGAWQARELSRMGIPYHRRSDGSVVVLRSALEPTEDRRHSPKLRQA
jgi:hypothetical protein